MERSRTSLHKWFFAIFLFTTSRHGVAAKELERQLDITYKTVWRMAHETINHSAGEYVRSDCHVNAVEGFWSCVKNSIRGTHVHVSGKHLQKYAKKFEYRYNRRKRSASMFVGLVAAL